MRFGVATSWDIRNLALHVFHAQIADEAANELFRQNPELSARIVFSRGQKIGFLSLIVVGIVALFFWPAIVVISAIAAISVIFLSGTLFKFFIAMLVAKFDAVERVTDAHVEALRARHLPV